MKGKKEGRNSGEARKSALEGEKGFPTITTTAGKRGKKKKNVVSKETNKGGKKKKKILLFKIQGRGRAGF